MKRAQLIFLSLVLAGASGMAGAQNEPRGAFKIVRFHANSDQLRPSSMAVLDRAVVALKSTFPEARVELAGHSDETGTEELNFDLSRRRAQSVLNYLVSHGIESDRLFIKGYGSNLPVADNESEFGRFQNRRVEIRFAREPGPGDFH